jgi:hypothetical protein
MHVSRAPGRRAVVLAAAALLVVAGVIGLLLLLRGGDEHSPRRPAAPTGIEPLAFMPADADVVLDLDTGAPTVALAAAALVPRLPGATLSGEQLRPLLGSRMAIALDGGRMWLAAITQAPPPPVRGAAKRGGTVVVGPSVPAPRPGARAEFDRRFTGLPAANAPVAVSRAAPGPPRGGRPPRLRCWPPGGLTSPPRHGVARCGAARPCSSCAAIASCCRSRSRPTRPG